MKKLFSKLMTIIFAFSLALFAILIVVVIILGPSKAEKAIKALFKVENYSQKYHKYSLISEKDSAEDDTVGDKDTEILGVFDSRDFESYEDYYPFVVPTDGVSPNENFLYTGLNSEGGHEGIDIWTDVSGKGINGADSKGNPVYASCSGYVRNIWEENGDVTILCDKIDDSFEEKLPSLEVKTLYGHMADQFSEEVYIKVNEGQRVERGDLIGYQGNRCYFAPENRIVHLHFGVYDVTKNTDKPLNPEPYIGVSCTTINQEFNN